MRSTVKPSAMMEHPVHIFGVSLLILITLQLLIGRIHLNTNQLVLGRLLICMISGFFPTLWTPQFKAGLYAVIPTLLVPLLLQLAWSFGGVGYQEAGGLVYGMLMIFAVGASFAAFIGVLLGCGTGSTWRALSTKRTSKGSPHN